MGTAKVLGGVVFLALGIILLIIGIAPIPGLEDISFVSNLMVYIGDFSTLMMSGDYSGLLVRAGYLDLCIIIPYVGYHYCRAGVKSMRYDKKKKYYITETKIGLIIAGFIAMCVAVALVFTILLQIMDPAFSFLVNLWPSHFAFPGLLPQVLVPTLITLLIIFFIYWIGSKIMKKGIKKEELF